MDTRREFIKKAAMIAGGTGFSGVLPESIQKALAIDPAPGSTWLDAEHVVILMQENRSFDHCFGALRGVRGFNDPRAIALPDSNPVWLQTNEAGKTYAPFRLDIKDTKATWMGSLPHSWTNQVDARNDGKYDKWLQAKHSGNKEYTEMPLTLGHYNREDIPFYYSLADAFTVCDQNFCSSLTGTTPNRLYLWTGTLRDEQIAASRPRVRNDDTDYYVPAAWTTFPERLEDNDISWKIYQNEISLDLGFKGEEDAWLANFTDNPIEWFAQYQVRFSRAYMRYLPEKITLLLTEVEALQKKMEVVSGTNGEEEKLKKEFAEKQVLLQKLQEERKKYTPENYEKLSQREKNLHEKAFTTNSSDPDYHQLTTLQYLDGDTQREMQVPKGDVLHQFREDVKDGKLPAVSWLVAPENFSDHPGAPWYGGWYVSEALDILTQNPEVWKKTIFILCYDENDGYFDHVPPFVVPHPDRPGTGLVSKGIDTGVEYLSLEQDLLKAEEKEARASSLGLGFRVPLVIASPWSRGGYVNSQVFDHTSILQFLEVFLSHKSGKGIKETNISEWRRTVCGNLDSVFRPYRGEKIPLPSFLSKDEYVEGVHKAKFRKLPTGYKQLTTEEIAQISRDPAASPFMPRQEKGMRPSCALPYQLYADGKISADKKTFDITFGASNEFFKERSAGAPFNVYAYGQQVRTRAYAVRAGDRLKDAWNLKDGAEGDGEWENGNYHLKVYGPNGFFRAFNGNGNDPYVDILCEYERDSKGMPTGNIAIKIVNLDKNQSYTIRVRDNAYKAGQKVKSLAPAGEAGAQSTIIHQAAHSYGWYDLSVSIDGFSLFEKRFAGRVETGKDGYSDPVMG